MTIKVPEKMEDIRNYTPLPALQAGGDIPKYILLNVTEQWLGAYEYGRLVFSMPAATGVEGHLAPTGIFRAEASTGGPLHRSTRLPRGTPSTRWTTPSASTSTRRGPPTGSMRATSRGGRLHGCIGVRPGHAAPDLRRSRRAGPRGCKEALRLDDRRGRLPRRRRNPAAPHQRTDHRDRRRTFRNIWENRRGNRHDPARGEKDGIFPAICA